jgi:hypothetical protein
VLLLLRLLPLWPLLPLLPQMHSCRCYWSLQLASITANITAYDTATVPLAAAGVCICHCCSAAGATTASGLPRRLPLLRLLLLVRHLLAGYAAGSEPQLQLPLLLLVRNLLLLPLVRLQLLPLLPLPLLLLVRDLVSEPQNHFCCAAQPSTLPQYHTRAWDQEQGICCCCPRQPTLTSLLLRNRSSNKTEAWSVSCCRPNSSATSTIQLTTIMRLPSSKTPPSVNTLSCCVIAASAC